MDDQSKQSKGGKARAERLTQEERSRIAAEGGKARRRQRRRFPKLNMLAS